MKKQYIFHKAKKLREKGHSYKEIHRLLSISKSTCYYWLRDVELNQNAQQRIEHLQNRGRKKAYRTNRLARQGRDKEILKKVNVVIRKCHLGGDLLKLLCTMLYWSEGEKNQSRIAFTNSDPLMVALFMSLFCRSFRPDFQKFSAVLHLHGYHDVKKQQLYWSRVTGIPIKKISIYNKPNSGKNIRIGYPGCISIRYHDASILKEIEYLFQGIIKKVKGLGSMVELSSPKRAM